MRIRTSAVRAALFAVVVAFVALAFPHRALAGTLQIRDEAHVLAAPDADRLRSEIASAPFDARLVFTSDYAETEDLSRYVGSLVDEPNMVVVGVDPRHRHVQVHFGRGSGIARAEWPAVETAGNGDFREGNWAAGAGAIFRTASHAVSETPAAPQQQPAAAPSRVGSLIFWVLLIGGGIAAFSLFARRRSGYDGPGYPGYGGGPYAGGPYGGPSPGGMGPVGGGIIGAGLGGLAGYELGKLEGEREERVEREREVDDRDRRDDDNFDAGGGGSSWDDGGGSDGGGGGFDGGGGGGGSDF